MKIKDIISHLPLVVPILLLIICITILFSKILSLCQGHFVYTLDDTYIHMAMAKNLAQHGVWGVTNHAFTSASSSLFWTALLALIYFITGPNEIAPFIISLLSGILLLLPFYFVLKKEGVKPIFIFIVLFTLLLMVNLPYFVITGLEHPLHALVTVIFIYYASEIVAALKNTKRDSYILLSMAFLLPLLRYEGLVSILILFVLLLLQKKYLLSAGLLLAGTVPITIFGIISISHGWSFFPHSMLMKWRFPDITSPGDFFKLASDMTVKLLNTFNISVLIIFFILLLVGYFYFRKYQNQFSKGNIRDIVLIIFFMVDAVLYYIFSVSELSPRYQHFLMVMAIFISALILLKDFQIDFIERNKKVTAFLVSAFIALYPIIIFIETSLTRRYQRIITATLILIFIAALFLKSLAANDKSNRNIKTAIRLGGILVLVSLVIFFERPTSNAVINIPRNSANIYEQQYQTAQFLKRFYQGKEIAINDIGAPGYYADIKMTDLWGLADVETARMRRDNYTTVVSKEDLNYLVKSRNIKIAVIYAEWFIIDGKSIIPEKWVKTGEWQILNNIVCSSDKVSFYAVDISEKDNLINNLRLNSAYLPLTVIQSGVYTVVAP